MDELVKALGHTTPSEKTADSYIAPLESSAKKPTKKTGKKKDATLKKVVKAKTPKKKVTAKKPTKKKK